MQGLRTNRLLFTALLATVIIPLPAMTPALLSGTLGAMSAVVESGPATRLVSMPWYLAPVRNRPAAPLTPEDTILLGTPEPAEVIGVLPETRALPFEDFKPTPVVTAGPQLPFVIPVNWMAERTKPFGPPSVPGSTAVPEPATWAMLVTGFLLAGAALRRRSTPKPALA